MSILTKKDAKELESRWRAFGDAMKRAMDAIRTEGKESETFAKADAEAADHLKKIKLILRETGQTWMD
jgi:hypothetical protein